MKKIIANILPLILLILLLGLSFPARPLMAAGDMPLLSDSADLLTDKEEARLEKKLVRLSDKQDCDIAVYTTGDLEGKEAMNYADDIVDSVGLGQDRSRGTATLLVYIDDIDPTTRKIYISTDQNGAKYFSDDDISDILDEIVPDLRNGDYEDAFELYADQCNSVLSKASGKDGKDSGGVSPFWLFGDLGIGAAIASMMGMWHKSKLKTRKKKKGAQTYVDHSGIQFETNNDIFLDEHVERHLIERNDDRGDGLETGTTHTSSSGQIHGGGGRDF